MICECYMCASCIHFVVKDADIAYRMTYEDCTDKIEGKREETSGDGRRITN
jgi:hypothetical protein